MPRKTYPTGGDTVTARFLYRECFEFTPQFKLWLAANDEPRASDSDEALWRRILRVPFDQSIPKDRRDPHVKAVLRDAQKAGPAILAWIVQGALLWQESGLRVPQTVEDATQQYRDRQDPLAEFFEDEVIFASTAFVPAAELRARYAEYGRSAGIKYTLSGKAFNDRLRARGCFEKTKKVANEIGTLKPQRCWIGVALKTSPTYDGNEIRGVFDDIPI